MMRPYKQRPLSGKETQMLAFIQQHIDEYGYAPSIREMMTDLGISSTSVAVNRLDEYVKARPANPAPLPDDLFAGDAD